MEEFLIKFIVAILTAVIISALMAFPTMALWNYLMPAIFGLIKISFWQALCLNLLVGVLFGKTSSSSK